MSFRPSREQVSIRSKARRYFDQGHRLIGEIAKRIPELTMKKWREWEKTAGFLDWWSDLFPEHSQLTLADLRALEYAASNALLEAMSKGDIGAVGMVVRLMSLAQQKDEMKDTEAEDWYSQSNSEEKWLPQIDA